MVKVAIYARVSTDEQTTDNQVLTLKEYAERMGWSYDIYTEKMTTRKTRPVKYALMEKLRNGEYDAVVVYKLDRWARSSRELILEVDELQKRGIRFISYSDNLDLDTATGRLQFQILAAFAEFERSLIRERTIEGLKRAKKQGKRLGRPPGRKDSKRRRKSGYYLREAKKRQEQDKEKGIYMPIQYYLDNPKKTPPKK